MPAGSLGTGTGAVERFVIPIITKTSALVLVEKIFHDYFVKLSANARKIYIDSSRTLCYFCIGCLDFDRQEVGGGCACVYSQNGHGSQCR